MAHNSHDFILLLFQAKMMGVDPATMAAAYSAEAYLNLARYSGLLDRGSVSIAPVAGSSAGTSKASGQVKQFYCFY